MLIGLFLGTSGCEVPAATQTMEITIEKVSARDIDKQGHIIYALASVNNGACIGGPCSPSPCGDDEEAVAEGRTYCVGLADQHKCVCEPGFYFDTMTTACVAETTCAASNRTCGGLYGLGFPERGTPNPACAEGMIVCDCNPGYIGPLCEECDVENGYVRNGANFCALPDLNAKICRDGQGTEQFAKFIAEAEETLGHPPVELELSSASMEVVQGSTQGVRSWDYLFSGPVTLVLQTVSGFPSDAAVAQIPASSAGLEPLDFDMNVTRATTSSDPQFKSGDFKVGISAPTDRTLSEMFGADIKLLLEFNAY